MTTLPRILAFDVFGTVVDWHGSIVAEVLDVAPCEVMMVAAHQDDLAAARECGLQTAYVELPLEFGPDQPKDVSPDPANTLHARDFIELADRLGA